MYVVHQITGLVEVDPVQSTLVLPLPLFLGPDPLTPLLLGGRPMRVGNTGTHGDTATVPHSVCYVTGHDQGCRVTYPGVHSSTMTGRLPSPPSTTTPTPEGPVRPFPVPSLPQSQVGTRGWETPETVTGVVGL